MQRIPRILWRHDGIHDGWVRGRRIQKSHDEWILRSTHDGRMRWIRGLVPLAPVLGNMTQYLEDYGRHNPPSHTFLNIDTVPNQFAGNPLRVAGYASTNPPPFFLMELSAAFKLALQSALAMGVAFKR